MSNAISKAAVAAAMALAFAACSDSDRASADELYRQGEQAVESRNYQGAITLLDTLNSRYPSQTEIRRKGLALRAKAMEGIAIDSISAGDKALAESTIRVQELEPGFRKVESSVGLEGYYVPKDAPTEVMTATGIQPRVSGDGHFYLVANIQGRSIGLASLEFADGAESVSTASISPSRVVAVEGSESASFSPEDLEGVGAWLASHPGFGKCVARGSKGKTDIKISPKLREQILACYAYGSALQARRLALVHREKYERMLEAARNQMANLTPVPEQ